MIPEQRVALSQGIEDLDRRLEDVADVRPPLAGELSGLASLMDLDSGLADGEVSADALVRPSSIMDRLVIPDARQHQEQPLQQGPVKAFEPARTTGYVSGRMNALGLLLTKLFPAASPAVVFDEPPRETPVEQLTLPTLPTKPETKERGNVEEIEGLLELRPEELAEASNSPGPAVPGQDSLTTGIAELKQRLEMIAQQLAAH